MITSRNGVMRLKEKQEYKMNVRSNNENIPLT